ncbi:hypothetical protein CEXT_492331 [Caerostris extrusa]|uniref:Uncharacterized protein n=1 Tax=Caerostris extrusa TaxID=172846 RepID=A0AAV4WUU6_CAEEX|nr:hypothetical protein CEXT_492331 [Caerostris extrusa]
MYTPKLSQCSGIACLLDVVLPAFRFQGDRLRNSFEIKMVEPTLMPWHIVFRSNTDRRALLLKKKEGKKKESQRHSSSLQCTIIRRQNEDLSQQQRQVRVGFPGPPVDLDSDRRPPALSPSADIENKNSFHIRIEQSARDAILGGTRR